MLGLCALVALAITSCKKDETTKEMTFMATINQPVSGDRTHLDGLDLVWTAGNTIKVFNANGEEGNFSTTDSGDKNATFTGTLTPTDTYTAFYPNAVVNGSSVTLALNANQNYVANDFGNDTYPMAAPSSQVGNDINFGFHSPASVLRLQLKSNNTCTVKQIIVTGGANDKLAGDIVYANFNDVTTYTLTNTTNVVTLDCGTNGVNLGPTETTFFNIVLFGGTLSSGTTVVVKDMGGNIITTMTTSRPNIIPAEVIYTMPLKEVDYELVTVVTDDPTALTTSGATMNGHYVAPDGSTVSERGFYYSTVESDVNDHNSSCTKVILNGPGTPFNQVLSGLAPGTYHYRAYAVNNAGENWGVVKHFTIEEPVPTVLTVAASSVNNPAGSATMNGQYTANGATITEVGFYYGTSQSSLTTKVTVTGSTATPFLYTLNNLQPGTYYFKAYAKTSTEILAQNVLSFVIPQPSYPGAYSVSPTRQVVFAPANLQYNINPNASQSSTTSPMWRFAEHQYDVIGENANVQNAWDRFFYENNVTPENDPTVGNRYIDLFSWGTSGCPGSVQPWFMIRDSEPSSGQGIAMPGGTPNLGIGYSLGAPSNYTWYCPGHNDIAGTDNDWGQFNDIYNPRTGQIDQAGTWRTLTGSYYLDEHPENGEWYYLMHRRSASTVNGTANARYCKACINGVNGLILFPDEYTHPAGVAQPNSINESEVLCSVNTYTVADWNAMEAAYATFLPCGGTRHGWGVKENVWISNPYFTGQLLVQGQDNYGGYYWSSSYRANMQAGTLRFLNDNSGDQVNVNGGNNYNRELGCCVRLARTVRE